MTKPSVQCLRQLSIVVSAHKYEFQYDLIILSKGQRLFLIGPYGNICKPSYQYACHITGFWTSQQNYVCNLAIGLTLLIYATLNLFSV